MNGFKSDVLVARKLSRFSVLTTAPTTTETVEDNNHHHHHHHHNNNNNNNNSNRNNNNNTNTNINKNNNYDRLKVANHSPQQIKSIIIFDKRKEKNVRLGNKTSENYFSFNKEEDEVPSNVYMNINSSDNNGSNKNNRNLAGLMIQRKRISRIIPKQQIHFLQQNQDSNTKKLKETKMTIKLNKQNESSMNNYYNQPRSTSNIQNPSHPSHPNNKNKNNNNNVHNQNDDLHTQNPANDYNQQTISESSLSRDTILSDERLDFAPLSKDLTNRRILATNSLLELLANQIPKLRAINQAINNSKTNKQQTSHSKSIQLKQRQSDKQSERLVSSSVAVSNQIEKNKKDVTSDILETTKDRQIFSPPSFSRSDSNNINLRNNYYADNINNNKSIPVFSDVESLLLSSFGYSTEYLINRSSEEIREIINQIYVKGKQTTNQRVEKTKFINKETSTMETFNQSHNSSIIERENVMLCVNPLKVEQQQNSDRLNLENDLEKKMQGKKPLSLLDTKIVTTSLVTNPAISDDNNIKTHHPKVDIIRSQEIDSQLKDDIIHQSRLDHPSPLPTHINSFKSLLSSQSLAIVAAVVQQTIQLAQNPNEIDPFNAESIYGDSKDNTDASSFALNRNQITNENIDRSFATALYQIPSIISTSSNKHQVSSNGTFKDIHPSTLFKNRSRSLFETDNNHRNDLIGEIHIDNQSQNSRSVYLNEKTDSLNSNINFSSLSPPRASPFPLFPTKYFSRSKSFDKNNKQIPLFEVGNLNKVSKLKTRLTSHDFKNFEYSSPNLPPNNDKYIRGEKDKETLEDESEDPKKERQKTKKNLTNSKTGRANFQLNRPASDDKMSDLMRFQQSVPELPLYEINDWKKNIDLPQYDLSIIHKFSATSNIITSYRGGKSSNDLDDNYSLKRFVSDNVDFDAESTCSEELSDGQDKKNEPTSPHRSRDTNNRTPTSNISPINSRSPTNNHNSDENTKRAGSLSDMIDSLLPSFSSQLISPSLSSLSDISPRSLHSHIHYKEIKRFNNHIDAWKHKNGSLMPQISPNIENNGGSKISNNQTNNSSANQTDQISQKVTQPSIQQQEQINNISDFQISPLLSFTPFNEPNLIHEYINTANADISYTDAHLDHVVGDIPLTNDRDSKLNFSSASLPNNGIVQIDDGFSNQNTVFEPSLFISTPNHQQNQLVTDIPSKELQKSSDEIIPLKFNQVNDPNTNFIDNASSNTTTECFSISPESQSTNLLQPRKEKLFFLLEALFHSVELAEKSIIDQTEKNSLSWKIVSWTSVRQYLIEFCKKSHGLNFPINSILPFYHCLFDIYTKSVSTQTKENKIRINSISNLNDLEHKQLLFNQFNRYQTIKLKTIYSFLDSIPIGVVSAGVGTGSGVVSVNDVVEVNSSVTTSVVTDNVEFDGSIDQLPLSPTLPYSSFSSISISPFLAHEIFSKPSKKRNMNRQNHTINQLSKQVLNPHYHQERPEQEDQLKNKSSLHFSCSLDKNYSLYCSLSDELMNELLDEVTKIILPTESDEKRREYEVWNEMTKEERRRRS